MCPVSCSALLGSRHVVHGDREALTAGAQEPRFQDRAKGKRRGRGRQDHLRCLLRLAESFHGRSDDGAKTAREGNHDSDRPE